MMWGTLISEVCGDDDCLFAAHNSGVDILQEIRSFRYIVMKTAHKRVGVCSICYNDVADNLLTYLQPATYEVFNLTPHFSVTNALRWNTTQSLPKCITARRRMIEVRALASVVKKAGSPVYHRCHSNTYMY